jgi:beta-glucan synthesis-associated protein KRE6
MSQEINACDKINHYGMAPKFGRGSPEIDIVEAMPGNMEERLPSTHIKRPYQSTSLQVGSSEMLSTQSPVTFALH